MTKKYNSIEYFKNKEQKFAKEMINDTLKYQKQYGFKLDASNSAHNNEADAFRHTYMQSVLAQRYSPYLGRKASEFHEWQGNHNNQDPREANMDMWNNQQGQQIYNEIRREYPNFNKLSEEQQKDIIAGKVVQRMKEGRLITGLNDKRKFREKETNSPFTPTRGIGGVQNNGVPLGFAANIVKPQSDLSGYTNPLTGDNRIYTREDIAGMSKYEFAKHEKEIDAQVQAMGGRMPTNSDMEEVARTGGAVYVHPYTRSDGTKVIGYYRSK